MTLLIAAVAAISWLVVGIDWATGEWSDRFAFTMPGTDFMVFAVGVTAGMIYVGGLGGKKSRQTVAIVMAAIWLAGGIGWWADEWGGVLAITLPSLIVLVAGLLALPPFVLPVNPLAWKWPSALAMLYTLFWLAGYWNGWLEMNAIGLLVCLQGLVLIFRPAFPIESVKGVVTTFLLIIYGVIALALWRFLDAFSLTSLNLLILVQGILVLSCYVLPVGGKSKRITWLMLAFFFGFSYLSFVSRGEIESNLTNLAILLLGLAAFLRFLLPGKDETDPWAQRLDGYFKERPESRWTRSFQQYREQQPRQDRSTVVKQVVNQVISLIVVLAILAIYLVVWIVGLAAEQIEISWLSVLVLATGWGAVVLPAFIRPSENWHTFKAIITYNLGRNYPYYAVAGDADEPCRLAKRADGNSFLKIMAGPGITWSNADHAFVVADGPGFSPERVVHPGLSFIGMYQDVKEAVDLRYQLRARPAVPVKTRDGIDVNVVTFTPFRLAIERAVAITPDGRRAVVAHHSGNLKVWDLNTWHEERTLVGHTDWARAIAITPDGRRAVSTSSDGSLKVWNLETWQEEHTFDGHARVRAVAVTADARRLILGSSDGTLQVWELGRVRGKHVLRKVHALTGHKDWVYAVEMTPDGRRAVSTSADGTLRVWNVRTEQKEKEAILDDQDGWAPAVAMTPDGRYAVSASSDGTLRVWNLAEGQMERTLAGRQRGVRAIAMPNSSRAIFVCSDGAVKTWDLQTGQPGLAREGPREWKRIVGNPSPELGRSLPYDEDAVIKAAQAQNMMQREQSEKSGWDVLVRQRCKPVMRDIIAEYTVDELCSLYDLFRDPRVEIAARMRDEVRAQIRKWGLELIGGGISNLVPPDEIIQQRIDHWKAHLQKEVEILEAQAEAKERHMIEHARAKAEKELIVRITEVHDQLSQLGPERRKALIALRLLAAIDQAKTGSQDSASNPTSETQVTFGPKGVMSRGKSATGEKK